METLQEVSCGIWKTDIMQRDKGSVTSMLRERGGGGKQWLLRLCILLPPWEHNLTYYFRRAPVITLP